MKEEERERRERARRRRRREVSARRVAPRPHQTSVHKQTKVAVSHPSLPLQIPSNVDPGRSPPINCTHPPELQIAPFGATESIPDPNINLVFVAARGERGERRGKYVPRLYPPTQVRLRFTIGLLHSAHSVMRVLHRHRRRPAAPHRARPFARASFELLHRRFIVRRHRRPI